MEEEPPRRLFDGVEQRVRVGVHAHERVEVEPRAERRALFRRMMEVFEQDPPGAVLFAAPIFYGVRSDIDWQPYDHEYMGLRAGNLTVN